MCQEYSDDQDFLVSELQSIMTATQGSIFSAYMAVKQCDVILCAKTYSFTSHSNAFGIPK